MVDLTVWLELTLFALLMLFSGFFSSSETALFSLSKVQLEQLRQEGHPRVGLIARMLSEPRRLIVTILIGNELVNVAASVISASIIIQLYGSENKYINLAVMVPLLLLFGEITPKTLAIRNNVAFASHEARPVDTFARAIMPIRWLVRKASEFFITLLIGRERSRGNIITEDLVRAFAKEAVGEGALDHTEAQFIDQIFDFGNKTVEELMTPRSHIFFMPDDTPSSEILVGLKRTRHTKVPIYHKHRDSIVGILHARDLIGVDLAGMSKAPGGIKRLVREAYYVPESKPAADLFHTFRERKLSIALTVDEYGGITGLVTMEDLLECIFGEIPSPSDDIEEAGLKRLPDGRFSMYGTTHIETVNEETGSELSEEFAETIGGLLLHEYGELPPENTTIEVGNHKYTVVKVDNNRISEVLLEETMEPATGKEDGGEGEGEDSDKEEDRSLLGGLLSEPSDEGGD